MTFKIKWVSRNSIFLILLGCFMACAYADPTVPQPANHGLSEVIKLMSGQPWGAVLQEANAEQQNGTTSYRNAPPLTVDGKSYKVPDFQSFDGDFTPDAGSTKLAIFSDDGSDVYIDGNKIWSHLNQPQALPDLTHSLYELPVTLTAGQSYHIRVDYSNTIYTGNLDIDGATLFAYQSATVHVSTGPWNPDPALVGDVIFSAVGATLSDGAADSSGNYPDYVVPAPNGDSLSLHWSYQTGGVWRSDDGTPGTFTPYTSGYNITWTQSGTGPAPSKVGIVFNGVFNDVGYYIVRIDTTVVVHDDTTNQNVASYTGSGYIGKESNLSNTTSTSQISLTSRTSASSNIRPLEMGANQAADSSIPVTAVVIQRELDGDNTYKVIDASNNSTLPGQLIQLKLSSAQAKSPSIANWKWQIDGTPFKDYSFKDNSHPGSAALSRLADSDLNQNVVSFYWCPSTSGVPLNVSCQYTVNGVQKTANAQFSLLSLAVTNDPTQASYFTLTKDKAICPHGFETAKYFNQYTELTYDIHNPDTVGIYWTGRLNMPKLYTGTARGQWEFVQLLQSNGLRKLADGKTQIKENHAGEPPAVDTDLPYSYPEQGTWSTGNQSHIGQDSPGEGVGEINDNTISEQSNHLYFYDYLFFKPPGNNSCYVAVGKLDWDWVTTVSILRPTWKKPDHSHGALSPCIKQIPHLCHRLSTRIHRSGAKCWQRKTLATRHLKSTMWECSAIWL